MRKKGKIFSPKVFYIICIVLAVVALVIAIMIVNKQPSSSLCSRNRLLYIPNPNIISPCSLSELQDVIKDAYVNKRRIMPYGQLTSHSYPIHDTNSVIYINMAKFNKIKGISPNGIFVTVEAGVIVGNLLQYLSDYGLITEEIPSTKDASIGGLVMSGNHGVEGRSFSSIVGSMIMVMGNGEVKEITDGDDIFKAIIISMGTIGILYSLVLRVIPSGYTTHVRRHSTLNEEKSPKYFLWDPRTDSCLAYEWRRLDSVSIDLDASNHRIKKYSIREHMVTNKVISSLYTNVTSTIPLLRRLLGSRITHKSLDTGEVLVGPIDTLCLPLQPITQVIPTIEMEVALPIEYFDSALDILRNKASNVIPIYGWKISFGKKDPCGWLSPSHDHDVVYISATVGIHDKKDILAKYIYDNFIIGLNGKYTWGTYMYPNRDKEHIKKSYGEHWDNYITIKNVYDPHNLLGDIL